MKSRNILIILALLSASSLSNAQSGMFCKAVSSELKESFADIKNHISEENQIQLSLLQNCATQHAYCIIVQAPAPKWFALLASDSQSDIQSKKMESLHAVSALRSIDTKPGIGRCVLSRFSGGSATVWTIDAWEISAGVARTLATDSVELHGEFKSPAELSREMEKIGRRLR